MTSATGNSHEKTRRRTGIPLRSTADGELGRRVAGRFVLLAALVFPAAGFSASNASIPDGYYIEMSLGHKSGGSSFHDELAQLLADKAREHSATVLCTKGPSLESLTGYQVEQWRKKNRTELANRCKNSGAVYVGPFDTLEQASKDGSQYWEVMLHAYVNGIVNCVRAKCVMVTEQR